MNKFKSLIASGTISGLIAVCLPIAASAAPKTNLPPAPTAALSCKDPTAVLSAADCEHFNEIIRHLDHVSAATLESLAFLDELQSEVVASAAYQDVLNQELSETESLRLQLALDRTSRFLQTLSNILKKISETSETITQHIKG